MTEKSPYDRLAEHVATKAAEKDTPFTEAIDALKAVTVYLTMAGKQRGADLPEPGDEPDFGTFRADLDRAEDTNGTTSLRGRRRTGS